MHASVNVGCQGKSGPGKIHEVILVVYQTLKTVLDHISKQREESWKYDVAQRSIFDELWGVWNCSSNTVLSVWYIFSIKTKTKKKTKK